MVNDLGSMDDLELMPLGGGYMVRRERLMNELLAKGRKAGIVVLYAPDGFGKTSVLLQYTHEVKCDPTRGPVRIIEADRAIGRELFMQLEVVTDELKDKPHSLIAIDNVPNLDQHDTEDLIDRIRGLRAMGVGVFISCRPSNRQLIHGLGDSVKINAQMLKVHAYEYSAWASAFSISTSLDFYQLTQGVPELVSALQTGLYGQGDVAGLLENEIVNVYGAALVDLASLDNNALFCVACLMILMGEGNIAELEACGVRLSMVDQSYFVRDYPIFGLDPAERSFTCLGTEDNGRLRLRKLVAEVRPELVPRAARILLKAGRWGVRTESWTAGRSGLEVRMYSREKVELFLLATEDGMGPTAAAEFAGVSVGAAKKWATGHLPHSYTGARCRIVARKPPRKEASLGPDKSIYAPPATGPLAGLNEDQIENLLLRAVLADLKAEGWDPASISNRSKCELGERLRRATALPLRSITGFLRISKSSYEYWRPRVAVPRDRDADIRDRVVRIFREGSGCWGYRTVWARLRREGVRASEKRVARVMREEGLEVVYNKRRARGYSSYAGEVSKAPENLVNRNFHADEPNRLWLTDITEFRLPGGEKVYLSPVIDCFDGMPVAWSIGLHPDKRLANSSLLKACAARPSGARTTIHSDRGGHYRWPEWIGICEENGLVRSMSAKGCSPDNSACEGFFGRLKNEFFRYRDWEGVTAEEFMGRLEAYLVYYRDGRIKKSLGWLSPMEYRRKLGYA